VTHGLFRTFDYSKVGEKLAFLSSVFFRITPACAGLAQMSPKAATPTPKSLRASVELAGKPAKQLNRKDGIMYTTA
jgi:hypothetical protein